MSVFGNLSTFANGAKQTLVQLNAAISELGQHRRFTLLHKLQAVPPSTARRPSSRPRSWRPVAGEEEDGGDAADRFGDVGDLLGIEVAAEGGFLAVGQPLLNDLIAAERVGPVLGKDVGHKACRTPRTEGS